MHDDGAKLLLAALHLVNQLNSETLLIRTLGGAGGHRSVRINGVCVLSELNLKCKS